MPNAGNTMPNNAPFDPFQALMQNNNNNSANSSVGNTNPYTNQ
jgi:hypothetical protein